MKTTDYALSYIFGVISGDTALDIPIYKLRKPDNVKLDEYIVINTLPIMAGVMQKVIVNVNFHCKDIAPGVPDMERITEVNADLMDLVEEISTTGILTDFESQIILSEPQLGEHFSNIRISVKIVNT
jgi:hypothetical protein